MTEYEKRLLSFILLFTTGFAELIADGAGNNYSPRRPDLLLRHLRPLDDKHVV